MKIHLTIILAFLILSSCNRLRQIKASKQAVYEDMLRNKADSTHFIFFLNTRFYKGLNFGVIDFCPGDSFSQKLSLIASDRDFELSGLDSKDSPFLFYNLKGDSIYDRIRMQKGEIKELLIKTKEFKPHQLNNEGTYSFQRGIRDWGYYYLMADYSLSTGKSTSRLPIRLTIINNSLHSLLIGDSKRIEISKSDCRNDNGMYILFSGYNDHPRPGGEIVKFPIRYTIRRNEESVLDTTIRTPIQQVNMAVLDPGNYGLLVRKYVPNKPMGSNYVVDTFTLIVND